MPRQLKPYSARHLNRRNEPETWCGRVMGQWVGDGTHDPEKTTCKSCARAYSAALSRLDKEERNVGASVNR